MEEETRKEWHSFGVNHHKAGFDLRQYYKMDEEAILDFYEKYFKINECEGFILSTCNRTAFFVRTAKPQKLEHHFSILGKLRQEDYHNISYRFSGLDAIKHLFEVGCGLDSQIPGDFEIIGQLRKAFILSKGASSCNGDFEKLINAVVRCSKRVKNETSFSSGTTSASYAAVRYLRDHLVDFKKAKIMIVGMGKLGTLSLENCLKHHEASSILVTNRSDSKSEKAAEKYGVTAIPYEEWQKHIPDCEALIFASSSSKPLLCISEHHILPRTIIDLGVPANVQTDNTTETDINILNIDQISSFINSTLQSRTKAIPLVEAIITEEMDQYAEWELAQKASPIIQTITDNLEKKWKHEMLQEYTITEQSNRTRAKLFNKLRRNPASIENMEHWIKRTK